MGRVPLTGKEEKGTGSAPQGMVKKQSVFWDLSYWKILHTPYSLDQMHITKNVLESLLGTLLNMPEKTKDGPKGRTDLEILGIREDLHGAPSEETETKMETETE